MKRRNRLSRGNTRTRARSACNKGPDSGINPFKGDDATKFFKRPPGTTNRAMWKKYPIPFVFKNPEPEGDAVLVRGRFYPAGTRDKLKEAS